MEKFKCIICGWKTNDMYEYKDMICDCGRYYYMCHMCFDNMDGYTKFTYDEIINVHMKKCNMCERNKKINDLLNET